METQQNWIDQEEKELGEKKTANYEQRPAFKLEENKVMQIIVDFSKPFDKYDTTDMKGNNITKAIIPVTYNNEKFNFWINKRNPVYREILAAGKGKTEEKISIMQVGQNEKTRYIIVK